MTLWDWLALAVLTALVLEGVIKGAVRLAFGLGGILFGYLFAGLVAPHIAPHLAAVPAELREPLAVGAGFFVVLASFVFAGFVVSKLFRATGLGILDRIAGALLGLAAAACLAAGLHGFARASSQRLERALDGSPFFCLISGAGSYAAILLPGRETEKQPPPAPPAKKGERA